eukprot:m.104689 g.104689  ORF g.104689 m.104689 type:complete len:547 (-) comp27586_c0_seq1:201-1841(-)
MAAISNQEALKGAAVGASYNVVLQLAFRVLTFLVNAVILRYTSSEMLGVVNVRLTLLYSTILFISREPFRKACLSVDRAELSNGNKLQTVMNVSWMATPVGAITASVLSAIWIYALEKPEIEGYDTAVISFAFSAVVELVTEPLWLLTQLYLCVRLKVATEGAYLTIRCGITIVLLLWWPQLGLYTFCLAQVLSSVLLIAIYYASFHYEATTADYLPLKSLSQVFPGSIKNRSSPEKSSSFWFLDLDENLMKRVLSFWKQSLLKQFLTEGEGYIMTFLGVLTFSEQGVYNIVNNLGSLVARFLFAPIEETYYTFFAGLLGQASEKSRKGILMAVNTLKTLGTFIILVSLTIAVFAQAYSRLLLQMYGGSVMGEGVGPSLLRVYAVYVVFLGMNGITECFMMASLTNTQVNTHNYYMMGFSIVYLGAAWWLTTQFGSVGFILANCVNMIARVGRSSFMIESFLQKHEETQVKPLRSCWPCAPVLAAFAFSFVVTKASEQYLCCTLALNAVHIGVGVVCLAIVALAIFVKEKDFLRDGKELFHGRHKQ